MIIKLKDLIAAGKKGNKFHAKRTEYNGKMYHSAKEARYRKHLELLKHAHELKDRVTIIEEQVHYPIKIKNHHCFSYFLDFKIHYGDNRVEYVDVKGLTKGSAYDLFKCKKACVEAEYGIKIKEV